MSAELIEFLSNLAKVVALVLGAGGVGAFWMRSQIRRAERREEATLNQQEQATKTISNLTDLVGDLINSNREYSAEIRKFTQSMNSLAEQIKNTNDIDVAQRKSSLEAQIGLAQHLAKNTANLQELSETFNKVGSDLKKAIDRSGQDVSENSRNLAKDIKGAVADEVGKLDGAIVPLTKEFQEAIVALTKALELLTKALGKISDIDANQEEIKRLVEEARTEIKEQLAKPMPAEVLPGPLPPPEPPKTEGSAPNA